MHCFLWLSHTSQNWMEVFCISWEGFHIKFLESDKDRRAETFKCENVEENKKSQR